MFFVDTVFVNDTRPQGVDQGPVDGSNTHSSPRAGGAGWHRPCHHP